MTDILQAARSYYGLADTESCTTQLFTNQAGQTCVAFEIPLTSHDFERIVKRMKIMDEISAQEQPETATIEGPTVEAMREAYNALSKAEKGRYGSFGNYLKESSGGIVEAHQSWGPSPAMEAILQRTIDYAEATKKMDAIDARQVVQVDAPEEPGPTNMDAVWLPTLECSDGQMQFASDRLEKHDGLWHLVQWAMLTDEQKQKAKP